MRGIASRLISFLTCWLTVRSPDEATFLSVSSVCAHQCALKMGEIVGTSILEMYAKCGSLNIARDLFNKMPKRNTVALNCMINTYKQYEMYNEAFDLFFNMLAGGTYLDTFFEGILFEGTYLDTCLPPTV